MLTDRENLRLLTHARTLLARPGGWVQDASSLYQGPNLTAYCVTGALEKARPLRKDRENGPGPVTREALADLVFDPDLVDEGQVYGSGRWFGLQEWNDHGHRTQEEVVDLFDRAIARQRAKMETPTAPATPNAPVELTAAEMAWIERVTDAVTFAVEEPVGGAR